MCTIYVQFTGNLDSKLKSINVMQILDELQGQSGRFWHKTSKERDHKKSGHFSWLLPLGVRPPFCPPCNGIFLSIFFFCKWILHTWNRSYTWSQSKISLLNPLMVGSKLTFISSSGRWLPTIKPCSKSSQLLYIHNIKPKLSAKHVFTVREWF